MRRWFLSYNSQDLALIRGLEAALRRKDPEAHIYAAPKSIRAGGFWLPRLADEIAKATVFVLLVGEKGIGPWQMIEYYEALARRLQEHHVHPEANKFPVVLMLVDGQPAPGLPFLRQLHWIVTPEPASEKSLALLMDAAAGAGKTPGELWRYTAPYRGLAAMTEADSEFFFGRAQETVEVIKAFEATSNKLPILLGNSGVGKSSLAQAGVLAALMRQAWPEAAAHAGTWPTVFHNSRHWCFLKLQPGSEPLRALVEQFLRTWQLDATDTDRAKLQSKWINDLLEGTVALPDLLDATELRYQDELHRPKPPAFFLYVDQGEELYVRSEERQRQRFSELLAPALSDPRLHALMSLRSDFLGALQSDEPLFKARWQIDVPPLREVHLRDVVQRPAELLGARFETDRLAAEMARRAAKESTKDAGALPLLSYLLDDMWANMVRRGDGILRLPLEVLDLGGVLAERANAFLLRYPQSEEALRRLFTLKLATVREDGDPTRRRAHRSEFTDEEWRLVSELASHPNRLLAIITAESGETYAEVAHEAVFRGWHKVRDWIAAQREFLAWRTGLEVARRAWEAMAEIAKDDALLMGAALTQAQIWLANRREDLSVADQDFIRQSAQWESKIRTRARRVQVLLYVLLVGIILGLIGVSNQAYIKEQIHWYITMRPYMIEHIRPYVLSVDQERTLGPGDSFRECAMNCPEMVVIPAGEFMMGAPDDEPGHRPDERPRHRVIIGQPFAVSKFAVTFADWDACFSVGGCPHLNDAGLGREAQPVIYVTWHEARQYVAWLSAMTGKTYRLITEAEYEYAARAGTTTAYYWGDDIGSRNANCTLCGSPWDAMVPAPVGSFAPNAFNLHDMHGNLWSWVQDCYHDTYVGAPLDGSAWTRDASCDRRVVRGGSWLSNPQYIRAASRFRYYYDIRSLYVGFRIGRALSVSTDAPQNPAPAPQHTTIAQQEETIYRAARGDSDKLSSYVRNCETCAFKDPALEEITYQTARGSIDLLTTYVEDCRICEFKSIAVLEIKRLEREQEEAIYRVARGDPNKLRSYVSNCEICAFKEAALEEITYYTARANFELLRTYVRDCRICEFKSIALREIDALRPSIPADATSAWLHNGSIVYLVSKPTDSGRKFYYDIPRPTVEHDRDGRLLFDGIRRNKEFIGTAYRYWINCRTEQFSVRGSISSDDKRIVLGGLAPQKNANCDVEHRQEDLVFEFKEMLAGCAEVLKTPDGFLNLREGPGSKFKVLAKLFQGDLLHIDKAQCSTISGTCDNAKEWTHVTSIPRLDESTRDANRSTSGWVTNQYIQFLACP